MSMMSFLTYADGHCPAYWLRDVTRSRAKYRRAVVEVTFWPKRGDKPARYSASYDGVHVDPYYDTVQSAVEAVLTRHAGVQINVNGLKHVY